MSIDTRHPLDGGSPDAAAGSPLSHRIPQEAGLTLLREHLVRFVPLMDTDPSARSAVEAVVNQIGERLGFSALHDSADGVGVWSSPAGAVLVVCPAAAGEVPARLRLLMQSRDRLLADRGLPARKGSALGVICGSLVNWRNIEETAGVHRTGDRVRLISLDALLSLAELRAEHGLAHTDAVTLLRPQGVRADAVVEMLTRGLRRGLREGTLGASPQAGRTIRSRY
jgi:hypothetical protein